METGFRLVGVEVVLQRLLWVAGSLLLGPIGALSFLSVELGLRDVNCGHRETVPIIGFGADVRPFDMQLGIEG